MNTVIQSMLAGIGGMLGWGTSDFFAGLFSKKIGHFKTFFWSQVAGLIFTTLFIFAFTINLNIPLSITVLLPIAAVFYAGAYLLFYKSFEIGNVSIISATMNLWTVFTMVFAFIFLGQRLSPIQFLGVSMIIAGVTLVSLKWEGIKNQNIKLLSGVKETIIAAVLFGIFWNLSEVISEEIGWLATTIYLKIGVILFLLFFSVLVKQKVDLTRTSSKTKFMVALVGILEAAAMVSVNYGLTVGDVILVTPISSALSIVTIALAIIFLKEKITKLQGLGMVIVVAGIILTAF